MRIALKNQEFDTLLLPIEWRYSATVVGLIRFFDFVEKDEGVKLYRKTNKHAIKDIEVYQKIYSEIGGYIEGIEYNRADLTEERYLRFCETFYQKDMQHVHVEKILNSTDEYSDEQIGFVNNLLTGQGANTVLKKVFGKLKFDGKNQNVILQRINENRTEIIRETYRYKTNLYRNFSNTNKLFSEDNPHCRLLGYDLDENRKSKSVAYRFDAETFLSQDIFEFDFIPFAFSNSPEAFFINNNGSIDDLIKCNNEIKSIMEREDEVRDNKVIHERGKTKLIKGMIHVYDFFDFDVEVIMKDRKCEMFETFYIRKHALQTLEKICKNTDIRFIYGYSYNYYLNVEEEVIQCCMNHLYLDSLLERLLVISHDKDYNYASVIINKLIEINVDWKGDRNMSEITERAKRVGYHVGQEIIKKSGINKAKSYRSKLTNAIVAHDYDRVLEIMLQMAGYVEREISVIYDIIDNKDQCSDIAIGFTNALIPNDSEK